MLIQNFKSCGFLKCWILPVETAEPTNVSWTKDERNRTEDELMINQTSDFITEEDGDVFFKAGNGHPYQQLHVSCTYPDMSDVRNISLSGKKEGKKLNKPWNDKSVLSYFTERFQDHQSRSSHRKCVREELVYYSHIHCGDPFHADMSSVGAENWCLLQNVIRYWQKYQHFIMKEFSVDFWDSKQSFQKVKRKK